MDFIGFPKIARWSRECIVTEKIDGTNAQVYIISANDVINRASMDTQLATYKDAEVFLFAGSRTRYITPEKDNHGFARWVREHAEELLTLGPGRHFGEWWGQGIQRNYGLKEKKWSLFNITRWVLSGEKPGVISINERGDVKTQDILPSCCNLVPVITRGILGEIDFANILRNLEIYGSHAAPSFMKPEGIVIYHTTGNVAFKKTIEKDDEPKSRGGEKNGL